MKLMSLNFFFLLFTFVHLSAPWELWEGFKDTILGERCVDRWLPYNVEGFINDLKKNVHGQPFLESALIPVLRGHLGAERTPKKALALSFHGSPGIGKTFVSQIIAKHLFKNGVNSQFYKFISMTQSWMVNDQNQIRKLIMDVIAQCERSVFVFDEIEKMPNGIMEVIKSFLDFHVHIGNVDYRKSIFIFISNIGMDKINELSYSFWTQGLDRNKFPLADFEKALFQPLYNIDGGLKGTLIVKNYLIDLYLPFLPLEKEHVKKCIIDNAEKMKVTLHEGSIIKILENLVFLPPGEKIYSSSGCKNVDSLIYRYSKYRDEL